MPEQWDAASAIRRCPVIPWNGRVWRMHKCKYAATDPGGSLRVSGRYHRGLDQFPQSETWPALYFGTSDATCIGEICRHLALATLSLLNDFRLTELAIRLSAVLDSADPTILGLDLDDLILDQDYSVTQALGSATLMAGCEGLLVPSATLLGSNLVVFPDNLRATSDMTVVSSRDPCLYPQAP